MARHWPPGPVFSFECLAAARRWQVYVGRVVFLLTVMGGLSLFWLPAGSVVSLNEVSRIGTLVFVTVVLVQMLAVLFVAPAATAGTICVEKSRGTLVHLFVTDVSAGELVFGKLAARLMPVLSLMLCGLPVLCMCSLLGGIDAKSVLGAYLVTVGVAVVSCTMTLVFSIWARKPHQALLPAYLILGLWAGLSAYLIMAFGGFVGVPNGLEYLLYQTNPFVMAMGPTVLPLLIGLEHQAGFLVNSILMALALAAFASLRIRRVVLEQASRPAKRERPGLAAKVSALLPGPPLDGNPVLWREWHRKRPMLWTGRLWTIYTIASVVASAWVLVIFYWFTFSSGIGRVAAQVNAWEVSLGLLLLSISSATSLAEERDRGSLDVIMATPLHTKEILWGKWWGNLAMVPRLAILPIWVSAGFAMITDRWLGVAAMIGLIAAYSAAIASMGLALATWLPRLARSVGSSVLIYGLLTVGIPILLWLVELLYPRAFFSGDSIEKFLLLDPFFGVSITTDYAGRFGNTEFPRKWLDHEPAWPLLWIGLYVGVSIVMLRATLSTFDRCLGRMPEAGVAIGQGRPNAVEAS